MPISRIETNSIAPSQTLTTPIIATTMGVGGATPAGSGSGITFPAAQSGSSDANTLDDYEEGTWTPTLVSAGGSVTIQPSYSTMAYTKVGNLVTITGNPRISSVSSPTGYLAITNLPFVAASGASPNRAGFAFAYYDSGATSPGPYKPITALVLEATTEVRLITFDAGVTPAANDEMVLSFCYRAAN